MTVAWGIGLAVWFSISFVHSSCFIYVFTDCFRVELRKDLLQCDVRGLKWVIFTRCEH